MGKPLQLHMEWALFSNALPYPQFTKSDKHLTRRLAVTAWKTILHQWLTINSPSVTLVNQKVHYIFHMDWLETLTKKNQNTEFFLKYGSPYNTYIST